MTRNKWLRITGDDGNQHILWLPERDKHTLNERCECGPNVERMRYASIVTHQFGILDAMRRGTF